jgi:hypothetical protein
MCTSIHTSIALVYLWNDTPTFIYLRHYHYYHHYPTLYTTIDEAMTVTNIDNSFILIRFIFVNSQLRTVGTSFELKVPRAPSCSMILAYLRIAAPTLRSPSYSVTIYKPSFAFAEPRQEGLLLQQHITTDNVVDTTRSVESQFQHLGTGTNAFVQAIILVQTANGAG